MQLTQVLNSQRSHWNIEGLTTDQLRIIVESLHDSQANVKAWELSDKLRLDLTDITALQAKAT